MHVGCDSNYRGMDDMEAHFYISVNFLQLHQNFKIVVKIEDNIFIF